MLHIHPTSLYDLTLCPSPQWGANFPLWQPPEREPQFCFPLQNGNGWALKCLNNRRGGWALKCLNNRRSLLSISWPMIPDPINPKRISTNNCRSANRQLSSRDGTYIYISVMQRSQYPSISITFSISISTSITCTLTIPFNISIPTMQLLSSTLLSTSLTEYYLNLSHHNQNKHQPG